MIKKYCSEIRIFFLITPGSYLPTDLKAVVRSHPIRAWKNAIAVAFLTPNLSNRMDRNLPIFFLCHSQSKVLLGQACERVGWLRPQYLSLQYSLEFFMAQRSVRFSM